ncbi:response regulator [Actinacidiphila epipremni]|uniref:Response regulator n=1 Tax=Actinacidiphila epipremni TaxID=2053013 RepID=A0ABX0ZIG1_9ACTN|nr:response regulator [Actinacidiphila epipremni]NJP42592.1 response regulator [Actinacidiphila epipremni]
MLRSSGAEVLVVGDESAADRALAAGAPDVIVSDIKRGEDREAGFTYVRRLRAQGTYTGPVVYFTSENTQARRELAREVGALGIAVAWSELFRYLDEVMAARSAWAGAAGRPAPSGPPGRPYDGPPG